MARVTVPPITLTTALQTLHTTNSGVEGTAQIFTFSNHDTSNRTVTIHFVPNGGAAAIANKIIELQAGNALQPGESRDRVWVHVLQPGDFIQMKADANGVVVVRLSAVEEAPAT